MGASVVDCLTLCPIRCVLSIFQHWGVLVCSGDVEHIYTSRLLVHVQEFPALAYFDSKAISSSKLVGIDN